MSGWGNEMVRLCVTPTKIEIIDMRRDRGIYHFSADLKVNAVLSLRYALDKYGNSSDNERPWGRCLPTIVICRTTGWCVVIKCIKWLPIELNDLIYSTTKLFNKPAGGHHRSNLNYNARQHRWDVTCAGPSFSLRYVNDDALVRPLIPFCIWLCARV